jgi:hypothetical protein
LDPSDSQASVAQEPSKDRCLKSQNNINTLHNAQGRSRNQESNHSRIKVLGSCINKKPPCLLREEQQSFARACDREVRDSLLGEEQQSFARIKEGHKESVLPKNTISFIIAAPIWSSHFNLGAALVVLKLSLYSLAIFSSNNQPSPLSVDLEVRIVQLLAIFVASFTQSDVANAVQLVYDGYASVEGHFSGGVTLWGLRTTVFVAFLQGALGLGAIYELISDSRTVLDLFLNLRRLPL